MGLRTSSELLCQFVGPDTVKGTTDKSFDRFSGIENLGVLLSQEIKFMRDIYSAGNRAVHDGSPPPDESKLESHIKQIEKIGQRVWTQTTGDEDSSNVDIPKRMKWGKSDLRYFNKADQERKNKSSTNNDNAHLRSDNVLRPKKWNK